MLEDSEEVYRYLDIAICPLDKDQNVGLPFAGLLYPALTDRSADFEHVNVFSRDADRRIFEAVKQILNL